MPEPPIREGTMETCAICGGTTFQTVTRQGVTGCGPCVTRAVGCSDNDRSGVLHVHRRKGPKGFGWITDAYHRHVQQRTLVAGKNGESIPTTRRELSRHTVVM